VYYFDKQFIIASRLGNLLISEVGFLSSFQKFWVNLQKTGFSSALMARQDLSLPIFPSTPTATFSSTKVTTVATRAAGLTTRTINGRWRRQGRKDDGLGTFVAATVASIANLLTAGITDCRLLDDLFGASDGQFLTDGTFQNGGVLNVTANVDLSPNPSATRRGEQERA